MPRAAGFWGPPSIINGFPVNPVRLAQSSHIPDKSEPRELSSCPPHLIPGRTRNHPENPVLLSQQGRFPPAILALADGTVFPGNSIGATGSTTGEVVFNTAMTGYQQIVTLTYPHIGNYGVNQEDVEAGKVHAAGLIIRDLPLVASNFRTSQTLSEYLRAQNTVAIADIDTRKLTRLLRTKGAQNGCILALAAGEQVSPA